MSNNKPTRQRNGKVKKGGRRKRTMNDSNNSQKRQALRRLFARNCSLGNENQPNQAPPQPQQQNFVSYENEVYGDENEDPLLDTVPVHLNPEQLGFLLCAQETLRFLHRRGIPIRSRVFSRLRSRLLRGMDEIAMA